MKSRIFNEIENEDQNPMKETEEVNLYTLSDKTINILNNRIRDEYKAHYYYRAAANWCDDLNYKKAAAFFTNEANNELEHAEGIQKYMTGFNVLPNIQKTETKFEFYNLPDIIYRAYELELSLMKSYNKDSQSVFVDDITTFDFLTKYRDIQKESVVEYNDLINALELIDKNDKFQVLYFEQTYF